MCVFIPIPREFVLVVDIFLLDTVDPIGVILIFLIVINVILIDLLVANVIIVGDTYFYFVQKRGDQGHGLFIKVITLNENVFYNIRLNYL